MTDKSRSKESIPTPHDLREQVVGTRTEFGGTVQALAATAAQAQQTAAEVRSQVQHRAAHAFHVAQDTAPKLVREKVGQTAQVARGNRNLLIVGVAALTVIILACRRRNSS